MSDRKATIIIGSPRKTGSTWELAKEAGRGLTERGIFNETLWLTDLVIRDCQACFGCKQENNSSCILDDGMGRVYRAMQESSGLIVASPVYFGNVSGITRLWLDRLVPFIGNDLSPNLPGTKRVSFIFTQNLPDTSAFRPGLESFMGSVAMTGMSCREYLIAGDCEAGLKPPVAERPGIMERAFGIGRDLFD
jgi:multimeric flavodoxin WrbA